MIKKNTSGLWQTIGMLMFLSFPDITLACSACFSTADLSQTNGLFIAMVGMIGLTGIVLSGITAVAFQLWKKSQLLSMHAGNGQMLDSENSEEGLLK